VQLAWILLLFFFYISSFIMNIDKKQQQQALQKANELIVEGEKQRVKARLARQVEQFEQGDSSLLLQDEFISNVSQVIVDTFQKGLPGRSEMLLERIGAYAVGENVTLRERAVIVLSFCSGQLLQDDEKKELLEKITSILVQWLQVETMYLPICDTVCRQLQKNGLRILAEGHWQKFNFLLEILCQIQSGALKKGNVIRGLVANTIDSFAVPHILEELVLVGLHGQGGRQILAENILTRLGRQAVSFLLEKLLVSQQKNERLYLIKVITATSKIAVPVLKKFLSRELPWYGVRNVVLLIAAVGDSSTIPLVFPLLTHKDIRVQQQVLDCLYNVSGVDKKTHLISALPLVNDELKPHLIAQLGQLGCSDCLDVLLDILAERESIALHVRDELLGKLCVVLRLRPLQRSVILLRQLIEERAQQGGVDDPVTLIAKRSLQVIEPQLKPVIKQSANEQAQVSFSHDPHTEQLARLHLRDLDARIQGLIQEKKIAEATEVIVEYAVRAAKKKDFATAEILRDRILAVNPDALFEVVFVGEIIEKEESIGIGRHHLSLWSDLYDVLDTEMFNSLYYCLRFQEYKGGETIVQQGDSRSILIFINAGQVALTYRNGPDEIFLNRLNPGEIVGVGPFFDISIWTVTLTAISSVKLQVLEREPFFDLLRQHPWLESSLQDFCRRSDTVSDILRASGESRRSGERYQIQQLNVVSSLLDNFGNPAAQQFKGKMENISLGGLSLLIHVSKKENARLLLGNDIVTFLPMGVAVEREFRGQIVGLTLQDYVDKDYLVHVRFYQPISQADLRAILLQ
jgi:hypothetical protein